MRGFYKDRVYVWPFHKLVQGTLKETDEIVSLIVQLEIETSRTTPNQKYMPKFKSEDRYIIGVLSQIFSATFERINSLKEAEDSMRRTYSILDQCKKKISFKSLLVKTLMP